MFALHCGSAQNLNVSDYDTFEIYILSFQNSLSFTIRSWFTISKLSFRILDKILNF